TGIGKDQAGPIGRFLPLGLPKDLIKTLVPTVEVVGPIIGGQDIGGPVQGKASLGDTVAVASDQGPKIGIGLQVLVQVVKTQDHVGISPVPIGGGPSGDDAPIGDH